MSLDDIQMSPVLLQDLYKKSLIDIGLSNANPPHKQSAIPRLGNYEKSILLIIDQKDIAFPDQTELKFLMEVLGACKLSIADVALVNYSTLPLLTYELIAEEFSPAKIIFFDVEPDMLNFPMHFPRFKVQKYNNQTYLCAPSLKQLGAEKDQKILLWGCLKTLFDIS